jgi:hypothetical protein
MTVHKRTEVTVETDRVLIIRRRHSTRVWCGECAREVDMVGLADASVLTGITQQGMRHGAQARKWHFSEGQDGTPLICLESLLQSL